MTRNVIYTSLILAFVAGFCDAATFTSAAQLFSAHVTGNLIIFAYGLVKGGDARTWEKLITFPVFVAAVLMAGWMAPKFRSDYRLLFIEGVVLFCAGAVTILLTVLGLQLEWWNAVMPFLIVWAMGVQNAFGRIYGKAVYTQTTVMTGNVTQLTLEISKLLFKRNGEASAGNVYRQTAIVGVFLGGCVAGAVGAEFLGLWTVIFPGVLLGVIYG